ncbi:MAG: hypothetical protein NXI31_11190 [bacterium]|nr:hypothetical protein [bacterium]
MTDLDTLPKATPASDSTNDHAVANHGGSPRANAVWSVPKTQSTGVLQLLLVRFGGIAAAFGCCALAVELDGSYVFHTVLVSALLIVMSMAWFGLVASHGFGLVGRFFAVVAGRAAANEAEAAQLCAMARRGRRLCYAGGVFAALSGVIHVLSVLDQPALIGPGAAVALMGPVYGLLLAELFFGAAESWVRVPSDAN